MPLSSQVYSVLIESAKNSQLKSPSICAFLLQNEHSNSLSYQTYPESILHRICPLSHYQLPNEVTQLWSSQWLPDESLFICGVMNVTNLVSVATLGSMGTITAYCQVTQREHNGNIWDCHFKLFVSQWFLLFIFYHKWIW